jgi:hypothetical protein
VRRQRSTFCPDVKASAALRHSRSGGSNLGGEQTWWLEHNGMSAASKSLPREVASWTKAGSRPNLPRGRPMTSGKLTGACTRWDRRGRGPGNQGKTRRITSRRSRWQQGLVATCKDSSNEVKNRSRGEPHGIGTCARTSDDRGVMSPQEAGYVSLTKATPTSGKGALGAWWSLRQARARLDKTGHTKP